MLVLTKVRHTYVYFKVCLHFSALSCQKIHKYIILNVRTISVQQIRYFISSFLNFYCVESTATTNTDVKHAIKC